MNLLKYTNSVGHLIVSVVCIITGALLILLTPDGYAHDIGVTMLLTVMSAWFVSGAAKQVAHEVKNATQPLDKKEP